MDIFLTLLSIAGIVFGCLGFFAPRIYDPITFGEALFFISIFSGGAMYLIIS